MVLELVHVERHTDTAKVTDTSVIFPFQICQNGNMLKKNNNILDIKYVAYKSCNMQISCFSCYSSTHLKCDDNTAQSSNSLKHDDINTLHNMFPYTVVYATMNMLNGHNTQQLYTSHLVHLSKQSVLAALPSCFSHQFLCGACKLLKQWSLTALSCDRITRHSTSCGDTCSWPKAWCTG